VIDDASGQWPALLHLRRAEGERIIGGAYSDEGLRERKKRLMRQQISDTATAMFIERGFDHVRVSEVAAACGVSEKTVYNYFPTKETLLLDREDAMAADIRAALGPGAPRVSPVDAIVRTLAAQADELASSWTASGFLEMSGLRRFTDMIQQTPSLRATQIDMMERLTQVAAEAMAARAGVNPEDPEPQIAADALLGLWRIYFHALRRYSDEHHTPTEVLGEAMLEVRRAARLIDTGLWSFGVAVQGRSGRQQLQAAAEASNEARKQVLAAIKQARATWHLIKADVRDHEDRRR
jgi:AcrR family transcriptional regulator